MPSPPMDFTAARVCGASDQPTQPAAIWPTDYPLVLTNAKFTTYIHSQLRGLSSLRKASPEPSADIHPETAERYGIAEKQLDDHRKPARLDSRQSASHGRDRAGRRLLPAWLVAGV